MSGKLLYLNLKLHETKTINFTFKEAITSYFAKTYSK